MENEVSVSVINKGHVSLKDDFIGRLRHLLTEKQVIKSYRVAESYGSEIEEAELEVNDMTLTLRLSRAVKQSF